MSKPPPWLTAGRDFYKAAFEKRTRPGLDASIDDWMHLSPEEHAFVTNHLLYLNLLAQADQVALLEDIQARLTDSQGAQEELVEALLSARSAGEAEDTGDYDDGFYEDDSAVVDALFSEDEDDSFFDEEGPEDDPAELNDTIEPDENEEAVDEPLIVIDVPSKTTEIRTGAG